MTRPAFDGATFVETRDGCRLRAQQALVALCLRDHDWWTFERLQLALLARYGVSTSQTGISARIRDLRKPRWGSHTIERRNMGAGLWEYRLAVSS